MTKNHCKIELPKSSKEKTFDEKVREAMHQRAEVERMQTMDVVRGGFGKEKETD